MHVTINSFDFIKAFEDYGRETQFSREALFALFDYFEELEQDIGEDIELDVIGICCDYTEYESIEEFQEQCNDSYKSIEDIEDETTVIRLDSGGFIVQNF
jgi:hypothetical protein